MIFPCQYIIFKSPLSKDIFAVCEDFIGQFGLSVDLLGLEYIFNYQLVQDNLLKENMIKILSPPPNFGYQMIGSL